ncbi:MAG: hypothetical protein QOJ29_2822 [Thermoleophilaceae bacterium]|nr:hypothetical protein [Thermoleophilaceae bacterium]
MPVIARVLPWTVALIAALMLSPAADASPRVTTSSRPLISDNITPVFAVPGVHPIGARIRGNYMYVTGPDGLTIYNISNPEMPLPTGVLPLPHFENEDVDLGGDTLLISNDPSEGLGVLYVIDISNPSAPTLVSATPNGYVDFCQGCFGIGAEEAVPPGTGHTASCIPGPQGACQYAYLAGTGQGIAIVDLTDRSKPFVAKTFKPDITGAATHDVQIDGAGLAWIVGYEGSAAYDISDPLNPRQVMRTDTNVKNTGVIQPGVVPPSANPNDDKVISDPVFGITVGGKGDTPIDFIHHDSLRFGKLPKKGASQRTYPAGGKGAVVGIVEEDYARPTCEGAGSFQTWKIGSDNVLRLQDMWGTEIEALSSGTGFAPATGLCSAHYFDQNNGLVANAWYEEGTRFLDVSDPTHIKQVGYWIPAKGETWSALFAPNDPSGQTVYALDFVRGIEVLHIDRSSLKKTSAPVRRSWLVKKKAKSSRVSLSHFSKSSRYGYICRIATRLALTR